MHVSPATRLCNVQGTACRGEANSLILKIEVEDLTVCNHTTALLVEFRTVTMMYPGSMLAFAVALFFDVFRSDTVISSVITLLAAVLSETLLMVVLSEALRVAALSEALGWSVLSETLASKAAAFSASPNLAFYLVGSLGAM